MIKMISAMKHTKDRMDNPMPVAEMNQLLDVFKSTGANKVEVATVIGHPNFVSYSKQWLDAIHIKGMEATLRCAHQNMEGVYNAPKYVGVNRKPEQWWIDEAVNAFNLIDDSIQAGDEEAIYPERTEGIFIDNTAFLSPQSPSTYANFFIKLHSALNVFPWTVGLSANNASELMSGWMPKSLSDAYGAVVIDHYKDGDPAGWEADVRNIKAKYGKPVYVQEGAPDRFHTPNVTQAKAYFDACKLLEADGVLYGFGSWSGWAGNPESIVDKVNGQYILNASGLALKEWWSGTVTPPIPPVLGASNAIFVHLKDTPEYGFYLPALSEDALKDKALNLGLNILKDGKIDYSKAKETNG